MENFNTLFLLSRGFQFYPYLLISRAAGTPLPKNLVLPKRENFKLRDTDIGEAKSIELKPLSLRDPQQISALF